MRAVELDGKYPGRRALKRLCVTGPPGSLEIDAVDIARGVY
jgi:hypothetical protein